MMSKKIISLLLSVLMLVSVLSVSAFAMEAETLETEHYTGTMTVSASAASVQVGDTFKVTVGITAADIAALTLEFAYDETAFEFVSGEFCENTFNKDYRYNTINESACGWVAGFVGALIKTDLSGDFLTLTFKALKEADTASVTVSAQGGTTWEKYIEFDNASVSVKVTAAGGTDPVEPTPEPTTKPTLILGDVNGDGVVNGKDATQISKYAAGMSVKYAIGQPITNGTEILLGDVNGDGVVNGKDATQISKYAAGMSVKYAIGEPIDY